MRTTFRTLLALVCCTLALGVHAQAAHWQVNIYDYQYDMTAYVALTTDGQPVTDYSDYEIAAFCGNECRGVATIQSYTKDNQQVPYAYLRIRSNAADAAAETITFKVYVKSANMEVAVENTSVSFVANSVQGLPSEPFVLDFTPFMPGDADGDGEITVNDVVMAINASLGNPPANFIAAAADMDGDGEITVNDIVMLIQLSLQ